MNTSSVESAAQVFAGLSVYLFLSGAEGGVLMSPTVWVLVCFALRSIKFLFWYYVHAAAAAFRIMPSSK